MQMNPETFEVFCAVLWQKHGYPTVYLTKKSENSGDDVVAIRGKAGILIQVLKRPATMWTESKHYPSTMDSFTVKREVARCIWRSIILVILVPAQSSIL